VLRLMSRHSNREVDGAVFGGLDRLGDDRRGGELCEEKCQGPDHDT
jgi:hypothetical protein